MSVLLPLKNKIVLCVAQIWKKAKNSFNNLKFLKTSTSPTIWQRRAAVKFDRPPHLPTRIRRIHTREQGFVTSS